MISKEVPEMNGSAEMAGEGESPSRPITTEGIMESLKEVYDPELAINIVDLGLVYGVEIEGKSVVVRMTLTSPGCPIGPMLQTMAHGAITRAFPDVESVQVQLVWLPPWDPRTMASEEAKDMLGIW
jgi:metal-sulfur cluster biosynthetic enzyme